MLEAIVFSDGSHDAEWPELDSLYPQSFTLNKLSNVDIAINKCF